MGNCCRRRSSNGFEPNELVGKPSPSRPEYDSEGNPEAVSPVSGIRRRINRTDPEDLPRLERANPTWSEVDDEEDYRYSIGHPLYLANYDQ